MRPLALRMQAFGPYAGEQSLDFDDLKGRRFFLIHGPTGSGKTTILDAMVFALYGDTSGSERQVTDLRSDHADSHRPTEVTFDFALGADHYRVWRRPAQERPKLRGDGVTLEQQDATLWRLSARPDGDRHEAPTNVDGKPLATGWSKVTEACREILGFRAEQFRQVVMLPQGRFQELLRADSAGRADILATLFGTQRFARLERALKEAAAGQRKRLEELSHERRWVLDSISVADEETLQTERVSAAEQLTEACERRARLDDARSEAETAHARARDVQATLDAAAAAQDAVSGLRGRTAEIETVRAELQLARAAALVDPAARHAERCAEAAERRAQQRTAARGVMAAAAASHATAAAALQDQAERAGARRDAERHLAELNELRDRVGPLATARTQLDAAVAAESGAAAELESSRAALAAAVAVREEARGELERVRALAATEASCATAAESARIAADRRTGLEELTDRLATARREAQTAAEDANAAHERWETAGARAAALEADWLAGQATLLAQGLQPGVPCPVCGATDHPSPARSAVEVPSAELVAAARDARDAALRERDEIRRRESEAAAIEREVGASLDALTATLGDAADLPIAVCRDAVRVAVQAVSEACAAGALLPEVHARAEQADAAAQAAEAAVQPAQEQATTASSEVARARAAYDERCAGVPEALRDPAALQTAIETATAHHAELQRALADAESAVRRAEATLADARAADAAALCEQDEADRAFAVARIELDESLVASGFCVPDGAPDAAAWHAARREAGQLTALEADITAWEHRLAEATGRAEQAAAAAAGLTAPDLAALEAASAEARSAAEDAASADAALRARGDTLEAAATKLTELRAAVEDGDRRFTVIGRLAQLTNGDNPAHLTLQRFVLGAFLDAVLVAASARLQLLSKGRYSLLRTDERRGGRRTAGLDLDVYDAWTGMERPVSTLSGGESFMAALCLALGLAETVQAYSGGIYLDTVFIDEGFGTLDDEALDLAVATLMDLQEGDRLVGIISHVGELRDRIDARLEISAERGTSSARFVVP